MILISPGLAMSALLATVYGAAFHLWRGGGSGMLMRYLAAAWGGFALGQAISWLGGWDLAMLGQVHVLEGTAGSIALLLIAYWLAVSPPKINRSTR